MTKAIKNLSKYEETRLALSRLFLIVIIFASIVYIYSAGATVMAAVESKQNSQKLQLAGQEYQELESEYFNIIERADIDYAYSLGFIDHGAKAKYASRKGVFTKR